MNLSAYYYRLKELQFFARFLRLCYQWNLCSTFRSELSNSVLLSAISHSAFSMRKILDERNFSKLQDEKLDVLAYPYIGPQEYIPREVYATNYDSRQVSNVSISLRAICNALIHSYVFHPTYSEFELSRLDSALGLKTSCLDASYFCITSDDDKKKCIYVVTVTDWLEIIDRFSALFAEMLLKRISYLEENSDNPLWRALFHEDNKKMRKYLNKLAKVNTEQAVEQ